MEMRIFKTALLAPVFAIHLFSQTLSFGPQYGIFRPQEADNSSCLLGGIMRLKPLEELGIEFALNYHQEKYFDEQLTVKAWPIQLSGMIYPIPSLYGTAGAGWYNVTYDFKSTLMMDQTDMRTSWHAGIGLEIPIEDTIAMACDIRYVFLDYDLNDGTTGAKTIQSDFYVMTIALLFALED